MRRGKVWFEPKPSALPIAIEAALPYADFETQITIHLGWNKKKVLYDGQYQHYLVNAAPSVGLDFASSAVWQYRIVYWSRIW